MQQLLLLPLLAPLLLVLLVGALNPRPAVALRLLTWTSAALPLGAWVAGAALTGAGLSAATSALSLRQGGGNTGRSGPQTVRRPAGQGRPGAKARSAEPHATAVGTASSGPTRPPGEPPPTVEVPFRVIRRGNPAAGTTTASAAAAQSEPQAAARAVGDGWDQPLSDDWS